MQQVRSRSTSQWEDSGQHNISAVHRNISPTVKLSEDEENSEDDDVTDVDNGNEDVHYYMPGDLVLMHDQIHDVELVAIVKVFHENTKMMELIVPSLDATVLNVGVDNVTAITLVGEESKHCDHFIRDKNASDVYSNGRMLVTKSACDLMDTQGSKQIDLYAPAAELDIVTLRRWALAAKDRIRDPKTGLLYSAETLRHRYRQRLAKSIDETVAKAREYLKLVPQDCDVEAQKCKSVFVYKQKECDDKVRTCKQLVSFKEDVIRAMKTINMDRDCMLSTNQQCRPVNRIIEDAAAIQAQTSAINTGLRATFKRFAKK